MVKPGGGKITTLFTNLSRLERSQLKLTIS